METIGFSNATNTLMMFGSMIPDVQIPTIVIKNQIANEGKCTVILEHAYYFVCVPLNLNWILYMAKLLRGKTFAVFTIILPTMNVFTSNTYFGCKNVKVIQPRAT